MTDQLQLDVELRPMTIAKRTKIGTFRQSLGQSEVFVNGTRVGFICDHDGAPLNFVEKLPTALEDAIAARVAELRPGKAVGHRSRPPSHEAVNKVITEIDEQAARDNFLLDDDDE